MRLIVLQKRLKVLIFFDISHGIKKQYQDRTWTLGTYAAFSNYGLSDNNEHTT